MEQAKKIDEQPVIEQTEVHFDRPKYSTRVFAFLFDFLCMAITYVLLMIATQAIVSISPYYSSANKTIDDIQVLSGLYVTKSDGSQQLICDYYYNSTEYTVPEVNKMIDDSLTAFYTSSSFGPLISERESVEDPLDVYNYQKIPKGETVGVYFIYNDAGEIVAKSSATDNDLYTFYTSAMSEKAVGYLTLYPGYIEASQAIFYSFYFVILLVPLILSFFIFEFIPPMIFKRGRKTLGKLVFKIGIVDFHGISPSFWRFLARFLIFFFLEIVLSVVTFLIPIFISFTMLLFSKMGQCFHDYISGTYVVDTSDSFICLNAKEYNDRKATAEKYKLESKNIEY